MFDCLLSFHIILTSHERCLFLGLSLGGILFL